MAKITNPFGSPFDVFSSDYRERNREFTLAKRSMDQAKKAGTYNSLDYGRFKDAETSFNEIKSPVEDIVNKDFERFRERTGSGIGLNIFARSIMSGGGRQREKQTYGVARQTLLGA